MPEPQHERRRGPKFELEHLSRDQARWVGVLCSKTPQSTAVMHRNPALQVAQVYDRSAATAASFVVSFVMAWSPFLRANAGIIGVQQPGDYANPIPTTSATGPGGFSITVCKDKPARDER
jgi:hypothetical protein